MAEYNPSKIIKDGNTYNFRDTTKIPLAGSNAISGSLIPSTDGTVNLGSVSYQWNNAYIKSLTINGVACGDILTHNVSEFVNVTGAQTIGGPKIFSDASTGLGKDMYLFATIPYGKGTPPAAASTQYINFSGNTASQGFANGWISGYIAQTVQPNGGSRCRWAIRNTDEKYAAVELLLAVNTFAFRPSVDNTMLLGLLSHRWKDCNTYAINGINPGALSLPSTYVNVDTTNWVLDGSDVNIFTPASDGWLGIQAIDTVYDQMHYVFVGRNDSASYHSQNVLSPINALWDNKYHGCVFIPVLKGVTYHVRCVCSSITATFYPCQGNV